MGLGLPTALVAIYGPGPCWVDDGFQGVKVPPCSAQTPQRGGGVEHRSHLALLFGQAGHTIQDALGQIVHLRRVSLHRNMAWRWRWGMMMREGSENPPGGRTVVLDRREGENHEDITRVSSVPIQCWLECTE